MQKWAAQFCLFLIRFYQKTLSLDHGPFKFLFPNGFCRFYPSCSEYGYECIRNYGAIRGGYRAFLRILRCNPFHAGGYDPVKQEEVKK